MLSIKGLDTISIHASAGEATKLSTSMFPVLAISIHASAGEATGLPGIGIADGYISIHASAGEATVYDQTD